MTRSNTVTPGDEMDTTPAPSDLTPWWLSTTVMLAVLGVVFIALPRLYAVEPLVGFTVSAGAIAYASYALSRLLSIYRQTQ